MPAPLTSREAVLTQLLATFRRDGYDGASLATLSAATGLGRSSLYHHFPGGKAEMAAEVLEQLGRSLEEDLLAPLRGGGTPAHRLEQMLRTVVAFYDEGRTPCLLEKLTASVERATFEAPLAAAFRAWIGAVQQLAEEAGVPRAEARERAEDAVLRIEGALIVGAGLGDPGIFQRTIARIRRTLLLRD